ncbi:MAG TPA: ribonuclease E/G [Candidatus Anaerostipes avistercoris]|uniref:Ribonuclease E/G n=1 Tax=Candidatus Anaerostipes avistercoris TaxID=2838462 RepID=A0A9D2PH28_9FIRM|nr:ribonuclease E/G [Candidatus Anaerostipes avistercoris]
MSAQIIITKIKNHMISAWLHDHEIVEFQCCNTKQKNIVGSIYLGKVKNVVKNINGAFVEFEKGELGFLPMRDLSLKAEEEIIVQVKKEGSREKKPLLSQQIELTGKYLVLTSDKAAIGISNKIKDREQRQELREMAEPMVTESYGFILRTSAAGASREAVMREAQELADKYEEIVRKGRYRTPFQLLEVNQDMESMLLFGKLPDQTEQVITDQDILADSLKRQGYNVRYAAEAGEIERQYRIRHFLREALSRKIWMRSGGFLYIEQTEAMAVIDVNTGKSIGNKNKADHIRKINLEAAKEAARQIRLRNLSGIIVIDFIDMKSEYDKETLLRVMQQYLDQDSKKAAAVDITKLGLMEITRKKERNPLFRQIDIDILD